MCNSVGASLGPDFLKKFQLAQPIVRKKNATNPAPIKGICAQKISVGLRFEINLGFASDVANWQLWGSHM